jgi:hypothetical protein
MPQTTPSPKDYFGIFMQNLHRGIQGHPDKETP